MSDQLYLTTPLYYVNDEPHIGHAYTTILADVLARYQRLFHGKNAVHFLTGLDEHGQKVEQAARDGNITPQDHCDKMSHVWGQVWEKLLIVHDDFIRTTEPRHEEVVKDFLNTLNEKGDIYSEKYEGWYSIFEERFFTEKDLVDGRDPIGGRAVEWIEESNYFFRMSKYQDWLIDHYEKHPEAILPRFRLNEVKGFLRKPLSDLCISRPKSRLSWGIPIPWDDDYVTYVWFDALINYYSATVNPPAGKSVAWPADYHLIGKDILTTHAVYWPIMLHAYGKEPPRHILAHGWWLTKDEAKMSKSSGNVIKPLALADKYGVDAFRYVLMREMVVGQDATFSEAGFVQRYNSDLANDLGNLFSRLAKLWKQFDWEAVKYDSVISKKGYMDDDLIAEFSALEGRVTMNIREIKPHTAVEDILQVVRGLNKHIERWEPWKRAKSEPKKTEYAMRVALSDLYRIAQLLEPIMPTKMKELQDRIMPTPGIIDPQVGSPLFPRLSHAKQSMKPDLPANQSSSPKSRKMEVGSIEKRAVITIDEFNNVDLRTAVIKSARKVEGTDKLLALEISVGDEIRQVVAGIGKVYSPDDLIGKRIIIVANLKPVKLRGELSEGMLLVAGDGDDLTLLTTLGEVESGVQIK